MRSLLTLAALALASAAPARDKVPTPPAGNYYLWYGPNAATKSRVAIVAFDAAGKAKVVATPPKSRPVTLGEPKAEGGLMTLPVTLGPFDLSFQAGPGPAEKGVIGSFGSAEMVYRGGLEPTDKAEVAEADAVVRDEPPPAIKAAADALNKATQFRRQTLRAEGEEKAKLTKQADEMQKAAEAELTKALREVYRAGGREAAAAAEALVGQADQLPADEVATYAQAVTADAKRYGPRFAAATATRLASTLAADGPPQLALEYAKRAAEVPGLSAKNRAQALKLLAGVQDKAGQKAEAESTRGEVAKLESVIDADYKKTVPPFKPAPYAGRKESGADRVAVLELFTGAQCPPCVAADVAFDALTKSYPAKDVVLLQYHLHIPGPDPLTNPASETRFEYYSKLNEQAFGGTPSAALDGKAAAGGGGPMGASEEKYAEFAGLLDKSLNEKASARVSGAATLAGEALTGTVEVQVQEPKDSVKLRLVLAEGEVKYVGGNGLRFHPPRRPQYARHRGGRAGEGAARRQVRVQGQRRGNPSRNWPSIWPTTRATAGRSPTATGRWT